MKYLRAMWRWFHRQDSQFVSETWLKEHVYRDGHEDS